MSNITIEINDLTRPSNGIWIPAAQSASIESEAGE